MGLTYFFDQLIQLIWYKFEDCQSFEICEPQIKLRSCLLIILNYYYLLKKFQVVGTPNAHNLISISTDGRLCSWSLDMLSQPQETLELQQHKQSKVCRFFVFFHYPPSPQFWKFYTPSRVEVGNMKDNLFLFHHLNSVKFAKLLRIKQKWLTGSDLQIHIFHIRGLDRIWKSGCSVFMEFSEFTHIANNCSPRLLHIWFNF